MSEQTKEEEKEKLKRRATWWYKRDFGSTAGPRVGRTRSVWSDLLSAGQPYAAFIKRDP